jgi:hypothetical protein
MQSAKSSAYESTINVVSGIVIGALTQMAILPLFGIRGVPVSANLGMACMFAVTSWIRSYYIRRWFNRRAARAILRGTEQ